MKLSERLEQFKGKKIGVLMGGMSNERPISLRSGENVYNALVSLGLNAVKIDIGRDAADVIKKEKIDLAFLCLHGCYGEDGAIQGLLEIMGIPYTGPGILGSSLGMNKFATKKVLAQSGIPVPLSIPLASSVDETIQSIEKVCGFPVVFKPNGEGSSIGVVMFKSADEVRAKLPGLLKEFSDSFFEQFVEGKEITIGILGDSTGLDVLPIMGLSPKNEFYDFDAKYTKGMTDFEIPAKLSSETEKSVVEYTKRAYVALSQRGVVRFDAIVNKEGVPYFLEVNTIPGMTDTSDIPAMARARGSFDEIVVRILDGALNG